MVGTLVVSLPSAHTGGELVIDHAGQNTAYRASKEELTFVAFYADCRHQVTPVRSGYRVTLTFNLLAGRSRRSGKRLGAQAELLGATLDVAAGLGVAGTAAMLLEPFRVATVTQEHAGGLAAAAGRYGEDWTRSVIDGWFGLGTTSEPACPSGSTTG
jgi:hypothetical protein